jgi:hypothetical protein
MPSNISRSEKKMVNLLATCAQVSAISREKKKEFAEQVTISFNDGSQITVFDPKRVLKTEA